MQIVNLEPPLLAHKLRNIPFGPLVQVFLILPVVLSIGLEGLHVLVGIRYGPWRESVLGEGKLLGNPKEAPKVPLAPVLPAPPVLLFLTEIDRKQKEPKEVLPALTDPLGRGVIHVRLFIGGQLVQVGHVVKEVGGEHVDGGVHELTVFQDHLYDMLITVPLGTHASAGV